MTDLQVRSWNQLGLPFSLHVRGASAQPVDAAVVRLQYALERADRVFSTYRPDSDVLRLRAGAQIDDVDPDVALVLELAYTAHRITGGVFDVRPGRDLDPSGVVKGWAGGIAFADSGLTRFDAYLNAGGDLALSGGPWRIGIEHPADPNGLLTVLSVSGGAVATSGSAHRGSHLWDPHTGKPVENPWQATVVGPELVWADILATAAAVAGPESLDRSAWPAGYEVMLCSTVGEVRTSGGFGRFIAADFGSLVTTELDRPTAAARREATGVAGDSPTYRPPSTSTSRAAFPQSPVAVECALTPLGASWSASSTPSRPGRKIMCRRPSTPAPSTTRGDLVAPTPSQL